MLMKFQSGVLHVFYNILLKSVNICINVISVQKFKRTPNGGAQNLRSHLITEGKKGRDKKRKSQSTLENINKKTNIG